MKNCTRFLLLCLLGLFLSSPRQQTVTAMASHVCGEICTDGVASCDQECWVTQHDFDVGNPSTTCGDQGYECCGNAMCEAQESCSICPADCGPC